MKCQIPAEGISLRKDWGDTKWYKVDCECGDENHHHELWVEADRATHQVTVEISTTSTTDFWNTTVTPYVTRSSGTVQFFEEWTRFLINETVRRARLVFRILFKGYTEYNSTVILTPQQAVNYADTLKKAVKEVEKG